MVIQDGHILLRIFRITLNNSCPTKGAVVAFRVHKILRLTVYKELMLGSG